MITKEEIPLNQIIKFKLESNSATIDDDAAREIKELVEGNILLENVPEEELNQLPGFKRYPRRYNSHGSGIGLSNMIPGYLLDGAVKSVPRASFDYTDIDWAWKTNRGTLPKRIGSWVYQNYKTKLPEKILSEIGNIARQSLPKEQTYSFDIVKTVDWTRGEFGDHGSCLWSGDRPDGRLVESITKRDYYAIRFFKEFEAHVNLGENFAKKYYETDSHYYVGVSRAWLYAGTRKKEPILLTFNGYGISTEIIANILKAYISNIKKLDNIESKLVSFDGHFYTNGERAYAIGDNKTIADLEVYEAR